MTDKKKLPRAAGQSVKTPKLAKAAPKVAGRVQRASEEVVSLASAPSASAVTSPAALTLVQPGFPEQSEAPRRVLIAQVPAQRNHPEAGAIKRRPAQAPTPQEDNYENMIDTGADPGHLPKDEVLDEAEQAQWMQLREQAQIALRARQLNAPETHPDFDGEHCVECDEVIPPARLQLRRVRCVDCQSALEESRKLQTRTFAAPVGRDSSSWE